MHFFLPKAVGMLLNTNLWGPWALSNAWPNKITGTDQKATGNEVAVESIVISHEGLTIVSA